MSQSGKSQSRGVEGGESGFVVMGDRVDKQSPADKRLRSTFRSLIGAALEATKNASRTGFRSVSTALDGYAECPVPADHTNGRTWMALAPRKFRRNPIWAVLGTRLATNPAGLLTSPSQFGMPHFCRDGRLMPQNFAPELPSERKRLPDTPSPAATAWWITGALLLGSALASISGCQWASSGQNAQGARLYQQGQYGAAMQAFQKAITSDPTNPDGYYNMAAAVHQQAKQRGDAEAFKQAESLYNQCLDHNPNHVECHRGLAVLLVDTGRPDRAFTLLKNWAGRSPTYAEPRIEVARLYEEHQEPQTALKYLEDAVQLDAQNPRAWLALGRLRESMGEPTQALQNYQRALAINGMQPMVAERVAALTRQLNAAQDRALSQGGTRLATPLPFANQRY